MPHKNGTPTDYPEPQQIIERHYHSSPNGNGSFNKFKDGALLVAMIGLVTAVWIMHGTLAGLERDVQYLSLHIQEMKQDASRRAQDEAVRREHDRTQRTTDQ